MPGHFSDAARAVIELASKLATQDGSVSVLPRHLLAALTIDVSNGVALVLRRHGYSAKVTNPEQDATSNRPHHFSDPTNAILDDASGLATSRGEAEASPTDIALAVLRSGDQRVLADLTERSIDVSSIIRSILFDPGDSQSGAEICDDAYQPERWSQEADRIVRGAQFERSISHTNYVGTEHILLSLLRDSNNSAAQFLERFYPIPITIVGVPRAVRTIAGIGGCIGSEACITIGELRLTRNANQLLIASQLMAQRMSASSVAPEHILLAMLTNRGSIAARALSKRVNLDRLERDLRTTFGQQ